MVDFRYHLVSIVAVFLALATGIAIGATALNGAVTHQLNSQIRNLIGEKDKLRSEYRDVQGQSDDADAFVKAITPDLITKQLVGRSVVVVSLPGADRASRDQAISSVTSAGATIAAQIRLTDRSLATENTALVKDSVEAINAALPRSVRLLLSGTDPYANLGSLIGSAMTTKGKSTTGATSTTTAATTALSAVLTGLHKSGLLDFDANPQRGELAIVVGSQPSEGSRERDSMTNALARALDEGGQGTVVIGPKVAAQSGGSISAVRGDARTALIVSTVDGADRPTGVLGVVRALLEQLRGRAGQYGTGVGAGALAAAVTR